MTALLWVYDLPSWLSAIGMISIFLVFNFAGLAVVRRYTGHLPSTQEHNEFISYYVSAAIALYGITLGLIAVATWQNFADADGSVSKEAAAIAALYRDVSYFPEPVRQELTAELRDYCRTVIQVSWPQQRKGVVPDAGTQQMSRFQRTLYHFAPEGPTQSTIFAEAMRQFNHVVELRRLRLQSVTAGLPALLWFVIIFGAAICIGITWLFRPEQPFANVALSSLLAALLGSLVYLIAALDNPFRGELSVSPDAIELVYKSLMK